MEIAGWMYGWVQIVNYDEQEGSIGITTGIDDKFKCFTIKHDQNGTEQWLTAHDYPI